MGKYETMESAWKMLVWFCTKYELAQENKIVASIVFFEQK